MATGLTERVLLIGWDAADWQVLWPMVARGEMPTLRRLIEGGVHGNLATIKPMLSPMLWTSIATGKRPSKHGVCGFTEPTPDGAGVRPVTSTSRRCKALWNILSQSGRRSAVIGWYATHPVEPIRGAVVSDQWVNGMCQTSGREAWPAVPEAVHPAERADALNTLRVHPTELDAEAVLPFVPRAAEVDQSRDKRLHRLAVMLARCCSFQQAAIELLRTQAWDLCAIYFDAIDRFKHVFMPYHPPRRAHVPQRDYELYRHVIAGIYRFHDMMLAAQLEAAGPETTVVLVSDHGYHAGVQRPVERAGAENPVASHRYFGMAVLHGPGIQRGERLFGGSVLDVAPTVLHLLGLPVGADMDGRPWLEACAGDRPVERVLSWEAIEGEDGRRASEEAIDPAEAREALRQLADLGYIEAVGDDAAAAVERTVQANRYQLAVSLLDEHKASEALAIVTELLRDEPEAVHLRMLAAQCEDRLGRREAARAHAERVVSRHPRTAEARLLLAKLALLDGEIERATEALERLAAEHPSLPGLQVQVGQAYLRLRRWAEATAAFGRALATDGDSATAYDGLAAACLGRQEYERAVDYALAAVRLLHHFPRAHYHLGVALARVGRRAEAIEAMTVAVRQLPSLVRGHRWLAHLLRAEGRTGRADQHAVQAAAIRAQRRQRRAGAA